LAQSISLSFSLVAAFTISEAIFSTVPSMIPIYDLSSPSGQIQA
jgi:hypothetical protein